MRILWKLFNPASFLMNRLRYPYRFTLISLLFVIPLALTLFILLDQMNQNSLAIQKELSGTQYLRTLRTLLEHLPQTDLIAQQYYIAKSVSNNGDTGLLNKWLAQQAQLEKDFKELARIQELLGSQLNTASQFNELNNSWQTLKSKGLTLSAQDSFQAYANLIAGVRSLLSQVGDSSNLILDNRLDTYYLINTLVTRLPQAQDLLSQVALVNKGYMIRLWPGPTQSNTAITGGAPGISATDTDNTNVNPELNQLIVLRYLLQSEIGAINTNLDRAFHNSPPFLQTRLLSFSVEFNSQASAFLGEVDHELAKQPGNADSAATQATSSSVKSYQALATSTLSASYVLWDQAIGELDKLLTTRLDQFNTQKTWLVLFALVSLGVVAYLLVAFYLGTIQTTERLTTLAGQLLVPKPGKSTSSYPKPGQLKDLDISFEALGKFLLSVEAELSARENRFYTIFHSVPVAMSILDLNQNRFIEVNKAFSTISGYSQDEAVGQSLDKLNFWASAEEQAAFHQLLMSQGRIPEGEMRFRRKSGEEGILLFSGEILELNGTSCILLAGLDITARKQTQEALERSEERFRRLAEVAFEGIGITENGILLDANPKLLQLTGYTLEEMLGKDTLTFIAPEHRELIREGRLQGGIEGAFEIKLLTKEGSTLPVQVKVRNLPPETIFGERNENQVLRVFAVNDLSERKHLEAQLLQAQKLQAVGQLAGGIAHDFNNLLTIILSYSELLLISPAEELPQMYSEIEQIKEAGERAAALTRQLLAFSRRQVLNLRILNLNEVVEGLVKMLRRLIGEDIELVTVLAPELSLIKADAGQLEQVILNLVVNARDAMPGGGKLVVETADVEVDESYAHQHYEMKPGHYVRLAVSDTGQGMDAATQARIFEPFFTTKEAGKGTGLGLATVHGIVKQSGGYIWVYSEVGQGTTFKIYLPVIDKTIAEEELPSQVSEENVWRGSETILLVEDETNVSQLIRSVLEREGYTLLESASDEAEGFSQSYSGKIDLLLTDVVMPKVNGREVAERILKFRPMLKVLYMSGYTDNIIAHHGLMAENVTFLPKPFTPKILAQQVRKILDN